MTADMFIGLLICDECGKLHLDDDAALVESCDVCGRFKQRMDEATTDDVFAAIQKRDAEIELLRNADPFAPLLAWLDASKSRSVQIFRDDGKGCSPWTCELSVSNKPVVTSHEWADGDWQGPAFAIRHALECFEREAIPV